MQNFRRKKSSVRLSFGSRYILIPTLCSYLTKVVCSSAALPLLILDSSSPSTAFVSCSMPRMRNGRWRTISRARQRSASIAGSSIEEVALSSCASSSAASATRKTRSASRNEPDTCPLELGVSTPDDRGWLCDMKATPGSAVPSCRSREPRQRSRGLGGREGVPLRLGDWRWASPPLSLAGGGETSSPKTISRQIFALHALLTLVSPFAVTGYSWTTKRRVEDEMEKCWYIVASKTRRASAAHNAQRFDTSSPHHLVLKHRPLRL